MVTFVDETVPDKHHLISGKGLVKLYEKGAVGAVLFSIQDLDK